MGKKLYRSIAYDKDGNISLEGTYGSNFRTFSNEEANKRLKEEREIDFKNRVQKRTEELIQKRREEEIKKQRAEEERKRVEAKKLATQQAAQREAQRVAKIAQDNVTTAKFSAQVEADKKRKQQGQELTWYKALAATAADLTSRVPGVALVLGTAQSAMQTSKGILQHSGIGKIGETDLTDVSTDPITGIKTLNGKKLSEEEYQDILYRDQKQYGEDQKSTMYNAGAVIGTVLNTGASVGGALVPAVLHAGSDIFGGISNLVRDSIAGSNTAGSDFLTKMELAGTNFKAGITGADVALAKGLDKIVDNDFTEEYLKEQEGRYKKISGEGTALQKEYSDNRAPYIERDKREEAEGDPLLRQKELDAWEAGVLEEPEWHKKKEGVFDNALGYFAKNPGRVFQYLAERTEDILRKGVSDKGAANSEIISAYQTYNDIKSKALFGKEMKSKDIEDFKQNSQQVTYLTEDGQQVSVPKNRIDPTILEEDSQASPDYMNIQEVETDEQGRALIDRKTGQVKYKSKYDGMFGLEKVGKAIDLGSMLDAQYLTQTVGSTVGSVLGFMAGGGAVAKGLQGVSAFSKSTRALNSLKTTYGAEAVEAAGLYGKAAAKLARGAKVEDISKNIILNYVNNDSEIRTNAEATRSEIKDELIDRAADMYSEERTKRREAILAERGITKDNPLFNNHLQNMIKEERAKYVQLNPEMALNIETKAEIGGELAAQAGRMQMLTSINETAAFFTRSKMLSRAGKMSNPVMKSIRTKALEAGFEGGEETIGDYSDKYGKSAILDNTFYSVSDYAKNDFVTKKGLETFALGALMGVGQNSLAGAKKLAMGESDNISERVQEYKEQKKSLKAIQELKSANSFDDVLKIYDQVSQQKEIVKRNEDIQEALDRGDTNTAHKLKQQAFASHSLRMAKLGLTGEVERNLQHLLNTEGIAGEPETVQELTRAIEVNKNIGNIYDTHTALENGDLLASNRTNKILIQEQVAKLKGDIDSGNPMYEEALQSYYDSKGLNTSDTSEEAKKLQEEARKEFDADEGSVGGLTTSVKKQIEKLESQVKTLDKSYYQSITADYQRKLRAEKQESLVRAVKKANTPQEVEKLLETLPEGTVPSSNLAKALQNKAVKFQKESQAKEPGTLKKLFNKKVKTKTENDLEKLEEIVPENYEDLTPEEIEEFERERVKRTTGIQEQLDFGEEVPVVSPEEESVSNKKPISKPDGVQSELFFEEPDPIEVEKQKKALLKEEEIPQEFAEGQDETSLPEGELSDREGVEVFNKTLENGEEMPLPSGQIDVSDQEDPVTDGDNLTPQQKLEQEKAKIVVEASEKASKNGISDSLKQDMGGLVDGVIDSTGKRKKASKKKSGIKDLEDFDFNIKNEIEKKQEQALKLFEAFRQQFKAEKKKEPTFKDLMEFMIANSGYEKAEKVNGFFSQVWIDSATDKDKARKEVDDAYNKLFALNNTINQLSNLANELADLFDEDSEEITSSDTEEPRKTVRASIIPETEEKVFEEGSEVKSVQEEEEQEQEQEEEQNDEGALPKPKIVPEPGMEELVGIDENGTQLVATTIESSSTAPQLSFSSEEYIIVGFEEDGRPIIQDRYPNRPILNRGDNEDRGGHMNLDNILNPMLAVKNAKLKIEIYTPGKDGLPGFDKVPFIEHGPDGKRVGVNSSDTSAPTKSFQDFLDKYDIDPVKYSQPPTGPETAEEQGKRRLFIENVPMHTTVEHNGQWHQLGTTIPSVNYVSSNNTLPKGNDPEIRRLRERNVEIKRNNIRKQRELIASGHSEFKVTDRVTRKFKTYELMDGNPRLTADGEKMTLSKAHPTQALTGYIGSINTNDGKNSISIVVGKKGGEKLYLNQQNPDIIIDEKSVENFIAGARGKNTSGWSVVLIYKNSTVDAEGNVKKIYGISQTVNNSNQEVQQQAEKSRQELVKLRAYYFVKDLIKSKRISAENVDAFLDEQLRAGNLRPWHVTDYRNIIKSEVLSQNADKIISKLSSQFNTSLRGLKVNSAGILVNSSTDTLLDGFPQKYGNELTVSLSVKKKGSPVPIIDIEKGTVEDYTSPISGRKGYDAFFEDSVGNNNMGYQIHDVTTGKDITVFSPQPFISFAPVNVQENTPSKPAATSSSIIEKKLAERREKDKKQEVKTTEEIESTPVPEVSKVSLEEEIENIIKSEVKYLDENGEEC